MRLQDKTFQRCQEDFVCERCGTRVNGNGYTNHCPRCLYSKHVDISPGDRQARCGGLMEPVSFESRGEAYLLTHRCLSCGHKKKNKTSPEDDLETLLEISRRLTRE